MSVLAALMSLLLAHPQGFHKKIVFTLHKFDLQGLMVMDIDGGERCSLIRAGADIDHDGVLSVAETAALQKRLVAMAMKQLTVRFSGAPFAIEARESKINLHQDSSVSQSGLSVAIFIDQHHREPATEGLGFEVADQSPDRSPVNLEVFQVPAIDAGCVPVFTTELEAGRMAVVRLGALAEER